MGAFGILAEVLSLVIDFRLFKEVGEEDIERNIRLLKKHDWFQDFLKDDAYRKLIINDQDVRRVIGTFKIKKLEQQYYLEKCHDRLDKVLAKKII